MVYPCLDYLKHMVIMSHLKVIWGRLFESFGVIWGHLGSFGVIWGYLGSFGVILTITYQLDIHHSMHRMGLVVGYHHILLDLCSQDILSNMLRLFLKKRIIFWP